MKITIVFAVILAITRIWIGANCDPEPTTLLDVYKTIAHIFISSVGTAWWIQRKTWQWDVFWALSIVEVVTAIISRM